MKSLFNCSYFQCTGPSMEPTLYTNDVLMTDCITPRLNKIDNGDIIIARLPSKAETLICKRIVGMSGDRLLYSNPSEYHKHRTINLSQLREESEDMSAKDVKNLSERYRKKFNMKEVIVPPGHLWIEGDNRDNSGDSRYYGSIPEGLVLSRVIARIWPPGECRLFLGKSSAGEE